MNDVVTQDSVPETTDTNAVDQSESSNSQTNEHVVQATESNQDSNESNTNQTNEQSEGTPEWFMKDKYSSIEEQAKSAFELQKKMGKFWGSPKDNYSIEGIEGIAKDDPLLEGLIPIIKEIGLSQEGFKHLVTGYQKAAYNMSKKLEDALVQELTVNDAQTYRAVESWMKQNLTEEEQQQVINNWLMTPKDFKLFNSLRLMAAPRTNVPSSNNQNAVRFESSKEVENDKIKYRREIKEGKRVPDKNYENELQARFRDARERELRDERLAR